MATATGDASSKGVKKRRSRKTCHRCNARKTKCDVQEHGTPCSKCTEQNEECIVRRRKNSRIPLQPSSLTASSSTGNGTALPRQSHGLSWSGTARRADNDGGNNASMQATESPSVSNIGSANFDFTALTDIDDIFNVTFDGFVPFAPDFALEGGDEYTNNSDICSSALAQAAFIDHSHQEFLLREGCFNLPPVPILREILRLYFLFVHPNIPMLDESEVWGLVENDVINLGDFSYLLFRAIVFSVAHLLEAEDLAQIGYTTKRDARQAYYKQAKMLFDFGIERDPVAISQACLILTYYAPSYNVLRVNSTWLVTAARYARIAHANTFYLVDDPERAKVLKRLWWCILFRDRILCLGIRQPLNVELDPLLASDTHILQVTDFESKDHDQAAQMRQIEIAIATCLLVQCLTPAIEILYRYERIDQRVSQASQSLEHTIADIHNCLEALQSWFNNVIKAFPSPIALDDASHSVCIMANMMFCYYSTAVFALNTHRILIYETVPQSRSLIPFDTAVKALEPAMDDISVRTQELLQVRLTQYLPISASAFIALPLILQAINVTAARGMDTQESVERRRLEVFTKTLESQRLHFDGSDMIADVLTNIVAYAKDEKVLSSTESAQPRGHNKRSLQWPDLIQRHSRMVLRVLLRLDGTLCNGFISGEDEYPSELRRNTA